MSDELESLTKAARQLIVIEELFGGDFLPAARNPLPAPAPARAAGAGAPAPAGGAGTAAAGAGALAGAPQTPEEKASALEALADQEVRHCQRCRLYTGRAHVVFGEGNPAAELVFVGEAPGEDEDRTGRPFVGRAGQLLTKMIEAMGLARADVYICNMVKCRPPQNRTPMPDEIKDCWPYLIRQLEIIRPKVIVTLGNPATQNLLSITTGITRMRGHWQKLPPIGEGLGDIDVMPTFHPSYVLRSYTPEVRGLVWSDLQQVMAKLGLKLPKKP